MLGKNLKRKIRTFCGKNCERMKTISHDDLFYNNFFLKWVRDEDRLEALEYAASLSEDPLKAFDCPVGQDILKVHWYAGPDRLWLDTVIFVMKHGADPFKPDEEDETVYGGESFAAFNETGVDQDSWRSNWLSIFVRLMDEFSEGMDPATIDFPDKVLGQELRAASIVTDEGVNPDEDFGNGCLIPKDGAVVLEFEHDTLVFCAQTGVLFCDNAYREKYRHRHEIPYEAVQGMVGRRLTGIASDALLGDNGFGLANRFGLGFDSDSADGEASAIVFDTVRVAEEKYRDRICLEKFPKWMLSARNGDESECEEEVVDWP